jgi:hypothetical protein
MKNLILADNSTLKTGDAIYCNSQKQVIESIRKNEQGMIMSITTNLMHLSQSAMIFITD